MAFSEFTEECPSGAFQKTITVTDVQTDAFSRMTPGALAREMADTTSEHMAILGLDYNTLRSHGLLWVLIRTALWVQCLPQCGESVLLRTWAGEERHWMYPHRTVIFSSTGEILVSACSQWMLIDMNTRRMAPPSEMMWAIPVISLPDEPKLPAQRILFPVEISESTERIVQPQEIDFNGHLNNSYYLDWAVDLLEPSYLQDHALCFLWVEYCKELLEGQAASLHYKREDDSLFLKGYIDGNESFSLKMEFGPV